MDKLYYIVCEEKGDTLFEGRFQGRTRGAAMKFLKEQIGRPGLNGTVFTITEIPVSLIREIIEAIMKGEPGPTARATRATPEPEPTPERVVRFDPYQKRGEPTSGDVPPTDGETDWKAVRRFYGKCRSPKRTAEEFRLSINTVKARVRREGWK